MLQTTSEQEQDLWIVSRRYVIGKIGIYQLDTIQEANNCKNAVQTLAQWQLRQELRYKPLEWWKSGEYKQQARQKRITGEMLPCNPLLFKEHQWTLHAITGWLYLAAPGVGVKYE